MSLNVFSQTVTKPNQIKLPSSTSKLIIKDLIQGDNNKQELILTNQKIKLLEDKIILKDSIICNLDYKIENLNKISSTQQEKIKLIEQLNKNLEKDLKKSKRTTKLVGVLGISSIIGVIFLLK